MTSLLVGEQGGWAGWRWSALIPAQLILPMQPAACLPVPCLPNLPVCCRFLLPYPLVLFSYLENCMPAPLPAQVGGGCSDAPAQELGCCLQPWLPHRPACLPAAWCRSIPLALCPVPTLVGAMPVLTHAHEHLEPAQVLPTVYLMPSLLLCLALPHPRLWEQVGWVGCLP